MKKEKASWLFAATKWTVYWFLRLWNRFEVHGLEYMPREGGCILISNHVSFLDPPAIGCGVIKRPVYFLARDTLFRFSPFGWYLRKLNTIPMDRRKGEVGALRLGLKLVKAGKVLILFPEGTRSPDGTLGEAKGGIGFLVAKSNAPVIPAYIAGTYRACPKGSIWIKPQKIDLFIGKPLDFSEVDLQGSGSEKYREIGSYLMSKISDLQPGGHDR